nr:PREDICTED: ceramide synthase 5-like isoform X2 [Tribolium castaneum]|eukprot:XP_015839341.1 PREDICTED: ceramide synthase 5-like isoform X2 [Tribolium castaneum]
MKKFSQSNRTSVRNSIFEQAYLKSQIWDRKMIEGLAKQSETSSKEVKTWLKLKNKQSHYTNKISTSLWRLIYHTAIIAYGTAVFWDKPWFWDIKECWVDVYNQKITNGVWWFFMISWAHICCSFLTVDTLDFRKKDFFLTLTHHVVLLEIMWISWKDSMIPYCSIGLFCHDFADIFLQVCKLAKYFDREFLSRIFFFVFMLVWGITRLGIFPFYIIKSSVVDLPRVEPIWTTYFYYYAGVICLCLIQILHCLWTYFIFKVAARLLWHNALFEDPTSDKEAE